MAMVSRAVRHGWPISDEVRKLVVDQMALVVKESDNDRNKIGAAKVLVSADSVNARREDAEREKEPASAQVNVQVNLIDLYKQAELTVTDGDVEGKIQRVLEERNGKNGTNGKH